MPCHVIKTVPPPLSLKVGELASSLGRAGLGRIRVLWLQAPNQYKGGTTGSTKGALVQLSSPEFAGRVASVVRGIDPSWAVGSYADFYASKRQQAAAGRQQGGASGGGTAPHATAARSVGKRVVAGSRGAGGSKKNNGGSNAVVEKGGIPSDPKASIVSSTVSTATSTGTSSAADDGLLPERGSRSSNEGRRPAKGTDEPPHTSATVALPPPSDEEMRALADRLKVRESVG